jgi:hypothetical protein
LTFLGKFMVVIADRASFRYLDDMARILLGEIVCVKKFCRVVTRVGGAG